MGVSSRVVHLERSAWKGLYRVDDYAKNGRDMLDTMTLNKTVFALCGSLLVFLLGSWFAEELYHVGPPHGGHSEAHGDDHGDDHGKVLKQAYSIEVEEAEVEEVVEVAFADVFATADAGSGEKLWRQCSACHKLADGANGTGPHLYQIVNRDIASVDGFGYSGALTALDGGWTPEALNGFIENPKGYAAGTAMSYRGMAKIEDRANLIAYLESAGG